MKVYTIEIRSQIRVFFSNPIPLINRFQKQFFRQNIFPHKIILFQLLR